MIYWGTVYDIWTQCGFVHLIDSAFEVTPFPAPTLGFSTSKLMRAQLRLLQRNESSPFLNPEAIRKLKWLFFWLLIDEVMIPGGKLFSRRVPKCRCIKKPMLSARFETKVPWEHADFCIFQKKYLLSKASFLHEQHIFNTCFTEFYKCFYP